MSPDHTGGLSHELWILMEILKSHTALCPQGFEGDFGGEGQVGERGEMGTWTQQPQCPFLNSCHIAGHALEGNLFLDGDQTLTPSLPPLPIRTCK